MTAAATPPPPTPAPIAVRTAIVTGASRGIGAAIATALAHQGRHVVLVARNADKLAEMKASIDALPNSQGASIYPCDMADGKAVEETIEKIAGDRGRLDILVNNAGITRDGLILRMTNEQFDEVINVNLRSVFIACRTSLRPMMRGKWGRIVNISSVSGIVGNPGQANYATAKAGLLGLTRTIAKELAAKNITANLVAPGFIQTDMTNVLPQGIKDLVIEHTPVKRFGQPNEIAAGVAYFTSEEAGFTTGQVLTVDGGMSGH